MKKILSLLLAFSMITVSSFCVFADGTANNYAASGIASDITVSTSAGAKAVVTEETDGDFGTALKITGNQGSVYFEIPEAITSGVVEFSFDMRLQDWGTFIQIYPYGTNGSLSRLHYWYSTIYGLQVKGSESFGVRMRDDYAKCKVIINLDDKIRKTYINDVVKTYDADNTSYFTGTDAKKISIGLSNGTASGQTADTTNILWIKNVSIKSYALTAESDAQGTVGVGKSFEVNFNEPVKADTVTEENIYVSTVSGERTECTLTLADDNKSVTVTPNAPLSYGTTYNLCVSKAVISDYANAMGTDYVSSFTTEKAENKVLLDEMFDNEEGGVLEVTNGMNEVFNFLETVTDENVMLTFDLKLQENFGNGITAADFGKFIWGDDQTSAMLHTEYQQTMFNKSSGLHNYFVNSAGFADFTNITAMLDLKTKIVDLYYNGEKMTTGYNENLRSNVLKGISFVGIRDTFWIDNLKVMTLKANFVESTSVLNNAEVPATLKAYKFNFFEASDNLTADNFFVKKNEQPLDSSLYTVTASDDNKTATITFNSNLDYSASYSITARAGITGTTLEPMSEDYMLSFTTEKAINRAYYSENFDSYDLGTSANAITNGTWKFLSTLPENASVSVENDGTNGKALKFVLNDGSIDAYVGFNGAKNGKVLVSYSLRVENNSKFMNDFPLVCNGESDVTGGIGTRYAFGYLYNINFGSSSFPVGQGKDLKNEYHTIQYLIDLDEKTAKAYFDGVLGSTKPDCVTDGKGINGLRFQLRSSVSWGETPAATGTGVYWVDNIEVKSMNANDMIYSDFANGSENNILENRWHYVSFASPLSDIYFDADDRNTVKEEYKNTIFTLKEDDKVITEYDLQNDKNGRLQIYINNPKGEATYEFTVSREAEFTAANAVKPENDIVYTFKLAPSTVTYTVNSGEGNSKTITAKAVNIYDANIYIGEYVKGGTQLNAINKDSLTFNYEDGMTVQIFAFDNNLKPLHDATPVSLN